MSDQSQAKNQESEYAKCYGMNRWLVQLPIRLERESFPNTQDGYVRFLLAHQELGGWDEPDGVAEYRHIRGARDYIQNNVVAEGWVEWSQDTHGWKLVQTARGKAALDGTDPPDPTVSDLQEAVAHLLLILKCGHERTEFLYDPRFYGSRLPVDELHLWIRHHGVSPELAKHAYARACDEDLISVAVDDSGIAWCWLTEAGWNWLKEYADDDEPAGITPAEHKSQRIIDLIDSLDIVGQEMAILHTWVYKSLQPEIDGSPDVLALELGRNHELAERVYAPIQGRIEQADAAICDALDRVGNIAWCLVDDLGEQARPTETHLRKVLLRLAKYVQRMPETVLEGCALGLGGQTGAYAETQQAFGELHDLLNSLSHDPHSEVDSDGGESRKTKLLTPGTSAMADLIEAEAERASMSGTPPAIQSAEASPLLTPSTSEQESTAHKIVLRAAENECSIWIDGKRLNIGGLDQPRALASLLKNKGEPVAFRHNTQAVLDLKKALRKRGYERLANAITNSYGGYYSLSLPDDVATIDVRPEPPAEHS